MKKYNIIIKRHRGGGHWSFCEKAAGHLALARGGGGAAAVGGRGRRGAERRQRLRAPLVAARGAQRRVCNTGAETLDDTVSAAATALSRRQRKVQGCRVPQRPYPSKPEDGNAHITA